MLSKVEISQLIYEELRTQAEKESHYVSSPGSPFSTDEVTIDGTFDLMKVANVVLAKIRA